MENRGKVFWIGLWMRLAKVCLRIAGCNEYDIDKALEDL